MQNYLNLQERVLYSGVQSTDRTGTGTTRIFAPNRDLRFNLEHGFPAPSTKKLAFNAVAGELLWFANGCDTIGELKLFTFDDYASDKRTIWCANYEKQGAELGYKHGYCGPVYGVNWRNFGFIPSVRPGVDQLALLVDKIINEPAGRRHTVYTVDPATVHKAILPPCHDMFQCFVEDGKLSMDFHMRSTDVFLGLPFNIASYALLCHILASICGLEVGYLTCALGDVHIYDNHQEAVQEQLSRTPSGELPTLYMPNITHLDDLRGLRAKDFCLEGYNPQGPITAPMAA